MSKRIIIHSWYKLIHTKSHRGWIKVVSASIFSERNEREGQKWRRSNPGSWILSIWKSIALQETNIYKVSSQPNTVGCACFFVGNGTTGATSKSRSTRSKELVISQFNRSIARINAVTVDAQVDKMVSETTWKVFFVIQDAWAPSSAWVRRQSFVLLMSHNK